MNTKQGNRKSGVYSVIIVLLLVSVAGIIPVLAAAPSNDDIASATVVPSLPYTDALSTSEATVEGTEPTYDCSWNVGATVWYSYTPGSTGDVAVDTTGSDFLTVVHVFDASGMTPVGCTTGGDANLLFTAAAGTTYLISIGGFNVNYGNLVFNMAEPGVFTACSGVDVSEAECNALEALYTTTNGTSWNDDDGWDSTDIVCTWYGISCSGGSVSSIDLRSNNLANDLSTVDLSDLTNLVTLDLAINFMTGDLPTVLGNLPVGIEMLYLLSNQFNGTISSEIASFTALKYFQVGNNQLAGDIALVFANLPASINSIDYSNNDFYGTIPAVASSLPNLYGITGFNNLQDGDIATVLGNLPTGMMYLNLNNNNFDGTISVELSNLTSLVVFDLGNNLVAGDLSTIIGYLPASISLLNLSNTDLTGTIPASISSFSSLTYLTLYSNPGFSGTIPVEITGLSLITFDFGKTFLCEPADAGYDTWKAGVTYYYPGYCEPASSLLFEDGFETGDFSLWTRFNDGNGYLYPCTDAAINGTYGACVDRGTDKRKQLIDETPIYQAKYHVRFNIDINSLWMAEGTRFRFIQVKMGAERPFFIVVKRQGGQYLIQLNTLLDDLTKVKTGWYVLSNAPHTLEIIWSTASGTGQDDGIAGFYLDDGLLEVLGDLDNDTIYVDTFKIGFTSRLDGKPISGIFYLDDIATANDGHIGLIEP